MTSQIQPPGSSARRSVHRSGRERIASTSGPSLTGRSASSRSRISTPRDTRRLRPVADSRSLFDDGAASQAAEADTRVRARPGTGPLAPPVGVAGGSRPNPTPPDAEEGAHHLAGPGATHRQSVRRTGGPYTGTRIAYSTLQGESFWQSETTSSYRDESAGSGFERARRAEFTGS